MIEHLPALQVVIPLMAAPLSALFRPGRAVWLLTLSATGFCLISAALLLNQAINQGVISYPMGNWPAP